MANTADFPWTAETQFDVANLCVPGARVFDGHITIGYDSADEWAIERIMGFVTDSDNRETKIDIDYDSDPRIFNAIMVGFCQAYDESGKPRYSIQDAILDDIAARYNMPEYMTRHAAA